MNSTAILDAFDQLEPSQQIQLVEDLWDRIAESPCAPPLTGAQQDELRRRKAVVGHGPPPGRSWDEVRDRLLVADDR